VLAMVAYGIYGMCQGVEDAESINWRRTFALATASTAYASFVYVPFLKWSTLALGEGTVKSVLSKTAVRADACGRRSWPVWLADHHDTTLGRLTTS
jgi:hypothetical protein